MGLEGLKGLLRNGTMGEPFGPSGVPHTPESLLRGASGGGARVDGLLVMGEVALEVCLDFLGPGVGALGTALDIALGIALECSGTMIKILSCASSLT